MNLIHIILECGRESDKHGKTPHRHREMIETPYRKFWNQAHMLMLCRIKALTAVPPCCPETACVILNSFMHYSRVFVKAAVKLTPLSVSAEQDKDILTDDKSAEYMPKLIDYLSDKGFDLIGDSRNQEKVADSAIDEGEQFSSSQRDAASSFTPLCLGLQLFAFCYCF